MRPRKGSREERFTQLEEVEIRDGDEGESPKITGIAIRYNRWSDPIWGSFVERFAPGAFTKTLQESDVRSLFNHDPNFVIGRTKAGTLTLTDTKSALRYEAVPPATTWADDLITSMRRGDIDQSSFAFRTVKDEWEEPKDEGGLWKRTVTEAQLFDVSPVTFPAYPSSTSQVRSALVDVGLDFDSLAALVARAQRQIVLSPSDIDLLRGSIEVLRSFIPAEPAPAPEGHSAEPQAGRSVAHLSRLLELEAAI
jgi:uncharacterized protein